MGCGSSTANVAELEAQVKKAESAKKMAEDELNQLKASTKKEIVPELPANSRPSLSRRRLRGHRGALSRRFPPLSL